VWADLSLDDLDAAEIRIEHQVDRRGRRQPLKTDESRRTIEIPRQLAAMLVSCALSSCLKWGMLWHGTNWTSQAGVGVE
jgi:hypothetical protein